MLTPLNPISKIVSCALLLTSCAFSDSMELRDGRRLHGKYLGGTATAVGFMTDRAVEYFPTSSVLVLVFDPSAVDDGSSGLEAHPTRLKRVARVRHSGTVQRTNLKITAQ